jgi:hypothetical protein
MNKIYFSVEKYMKDICEEDALLYQMPGCTVMLALKEAAYYILMSFYNIFISKR